MWRHIKCTILFPKCEASRQTCRGAFWLSEQWQLPLLLPGVHFLMVFSDLTCHRCRQSRVDLQWAGATAGVCWGPVSFRSLAQTLCPSTPPLQIYGHVGVEGRRCMAWRLFLSSSYGKSVWDPSPVGSIAQYSDQSQLSLRFPRPPQGQHIHL